MRKLLVFGILGLALGLAPAHAADPYCTIADANTGDDGAVGATCTITADDLPHGYLLLTPNDVRIFLDVDGNGQLEPVEGDSIVIEVSPAGADPLAGPLDLTTGANYTMQMMNGCAGVCGHIGFAGLK
ncbi:MAG TPA: hypothetical protein VGB52_03900 [Actinomycetota bacterium]